MRFFAPLLKVEEEDDGTLKVSGVASTESPDRAGEIVMADAIKMALPDFFAHGTGALREMHGLSAAGTVDDAEIDEANKTVITATVVDPVAIRKIQKGVYKGFSIGGKVLERDKDNRKVITKIALSEISLVDRPANPEAVLEMWKADGAETEDEVAKRDFSTSERKKDAKSGDALPDGSFPIETRQDLKNAIRAFGRAKNKAKAKAHIVARAKALGAEDFLPDSWRETKKADDMANIEGDALKKAGDVVLETQAVVTTAADATAAEEAVKADTANAAAPADEAPDAAAKADAAVSRLEAALAKASDPEDLNKGLYEVGRFAEVMQTIAYLVSSGFYEAESEGDNSAVPGKLRDWLKAGASIFKDMAKEEIDELVAMTQAKKADEAAALAKADDLATADSEALAKAQGQIEDLQKALADRDGKLEKLAERVDPLIKAVDDLTGRLHRVEEQPAPPKAAANGLAKAVSKEDDTPGAAGASDDAAPSIESISKALDDMSDEDRSLLLIKIAHKFPRAIGR